MGHDVSRQTASSQRATRLPGAVHTSDDGRLQRVVVMAVDCYWEQDAQQRFTCVVAATGTTDSASSWVGKTFWEPADTDPDSAPLWQDYQACVAAR